MSDHPRILVVAATARELAKPDGWFALECGVGPVEAAAATAAAIAWHRPAAILHVGIAGARRARAFAPASLVIGTAARYDDLGVPAHLAPNLCAADGELIAAVGRVLPAAPRLLIGTTARVGGSAQMGGSANVSGGSECDVEAMEGFAVLRAAELAGVPAVEVRAISNDIEETDRARWHFDAAFAAITAVTPDLVRAIAVSLTQAEP